MLSHESVWSAIDRLARHHGMTPSGLARRAGLDPTTFNPSKRIAADGRPRWPSMESIAKILEATRADMGAFASLLDRPDEDRLPLPSPPARATAGFFNDASSEPDAGWPLPGRPLPLEHLQTLPEHDVALAVTGAMLLPLYRDGDIVVVSPGLAPVRGNRVIVRHANGQLAARLFAGRSRTRLALAEPGATGPPRRCALTEIAWIARVIWASQ